MLSKTLAVLASAALAIATPVARAHHEKGASCATGRPVPTLPVNGGEKELAGPGGLKLKSIALGFGIQNYTCSEAGAEPTATGALAVLYDITKFYPGQGPKSLTIEQFDGLASSALTNLPVPLNLNDPANILLGATSTPFPADAPLTVDGVSLPFAGHHFFNGEGVPQFRLGKIDFLGALADRIPAPEGADGGPDGTGAVAWLELDAREGSKGSSLAYRVVTAGGNSHGCTAAGADSTAYATQYWFYN